MFRGNKPTTTMVIAERERILFTGNRNRVANVSGGRPYTGNGDSTYEKEKMEEIVTKIRDEGWDMQRSRSFTPCAQMSPERETQRARRCVGEELQPSPRRQRGVFIDEIDEPWKDGWKQVGPLQRSATPDDDDQTYTKDDVLQVLPTDARIPSDEKMSFVGHQYRRPNRNELAAQAAKGKTSSDGN
jgi:hypothetical protein